MATNKLLLLGAAGIGAYFLLNKSAAATTTTTTATTPAGSSLTDVAVSPTADVAAAAAATGAPTAAIAAAAAASAAALANVPNDIGQLAIAASMDLVTTLAIVQYDAIINNHPDEYSTKYFLANQDTWNAGVAQYKSSGIPELAASSKLDPVATLAVVFFDAKLNNHPTELSTRFFLANRQTWQDGLKQFQQQGRLNGLAGAGGFYSPQFGGVLPAVAPAVAPLQAPAWAV
jgi:hypothetical protein